MIFVANIMFIIIIGQHMQLWMISAIVFYTFFGHYLSYPSMTSVAYVFAVLCVMSKSREIEQLWKGKVFQYSIFITSAIYYKLVLYF